jgi:Asp-tRNA(Asn)/Glu-tRNA(Gln) amidotransferase A subunit family amidase
VLNELSPSDMLTRIALGETTAEAVMQSCLARIAEREDAVRAWEYWDSHRALADARRVDAEVPGGALRGLPIGVKDIMDTADMPTGYGSPIYAGHQPRADAACVALLRAAGAIPVGKTVTTEFATTFAGKTRNPHALDRTPGGSSSGSAAAVADLMVPVALGTQTMGSVIRPAAYCGVVAFKPSFGTINRAGIKPQAESIDTVGVFGRSVDAVTLITAILAGAPPQAFDGMPARPPRFGVYRGPDWTSIDPSADAALSAAARRFAEAGATVREIAASPLLRQALDAHLVIVTYELAAALAYEWSTHRSQLSPILTQLIERGHSHTYDQYLAAQRVASESRRWFNDQFHDVDAWLTASAPGEAPLGFDTGDPVFNRVWSLLHVPAITLPAGAGPHGLPLGIQVVGAFHKDRELAVTARWAQTQLAAVGQSSKRRDKAV